MDDAPLGFLPWTRSSPVTAPWEPIYMRETATIEIGTFLRPPLCNRRGLLHGGVIAALADIAMGYACGPTLREQGIAVISLLTTQLTVDYIGKVDTGWLQFTPRIVHAARNQCIADCAITADDRLVAHARALFRPQLEKT